MATPKAGPLALLALAAWAFSLFATAVWCSARLGWQQTLVGWIRPDVALGELLLSTAAVAHALGPTRATARRWLHGGCALAALGLSVAHLQAWARGARWNVMLAVNGELPQQFVRMAPLAVSVLLLSSAAASCFAVSRRPGWRLAGSSLAVLASLACAGFFASAAFHWVLLQHCDHAKVLLPGASLGMLCINASFLLSYPDSPFLRSFLDAHRTSQHARRLFANSVLGILLFSFANVWLHEWARLSPQDATALLTCLAIVLVWTCVHALMQTLRRSSDREDEFVRRLTCALEERKGLTQELAIEHAKMRAMFAAAVSHGIFTYGRNGQFESFNQGAERLFGYRAAEIIGQKSVLALFDPKEIEGRARALGIAAGLDVFRLGADLHHCQEREWQCRTADGRSLPVRLAVSALRDARDQITGYLGIATDLSAEKEAQKERDAFLQVGQELLCRCDPQTSAFRSASPAFEKILGYQSGELLGKPFSSFVHPSDAAPLDEFLAALHSGMPSDPIELRFRGKSGRYRWCRWQASTSQEDGLTYKSGWDVTEAKEQRERVQQLLQAEQHLIDIVGQDLRAPVDAMGHAIDALLAPGEHTDAVREQALRLGESHARARQLVNQVLDFAESRHGGLVSQKGQTYADINELVRKSAAKAQAAHPHVRLELEAAGSHFLMADEARLGQVLSNLVDNACKHTPRAKPVRLTVSRRPHDVCITVHNFGPAIEAALLPQLFAPFHRRSKEGPRRGDLGLGLYLVRQIVSGHGGTIDVQSSESAGTEFTILLPAHVGSGAHARADSRYA